MSAIKDIQMASNATMVIKCPVSKRRKVLMSCHQPKNIRDVTLGPLIHVASFLPAPSRAMFAMALSPDYRRQPKKLLKLGSYICCKCTSWQSKISEDNLKKIAGKCDFLDFGQLDEELAMRLSDDHIEYILLYLDRQDSRLKRIRLTNCTNVRGPGLWRLLESETIEQIDLTIAPDYTNPIQWEYWSRLKFHHVVAILDSIISHENSLKHVHLPWGWQDDNKWELANFIKRYKQMFKKQMAVCSICTVKFAPHIEDYYMCKRSSTKMQFDTCERCLKSICGDCLHDSDYEVIGCCDRCERVYCKDCQPLDYCKHCDEHFCRHHCEGGRIRSSDKHSTNSKECSGCSHTICGNCAFQRTCRSCLETDCGQCRVYGVNISRAFPGNRRYASHVEECHICERCFCRSCVSFEDCGDCGRPVICQDCVSERRCDKCDESFCSSCRSIAECKRCHKNWCSDCDTVRAWGRDGRGGYCVDCAAEVA